jgi:enamine deaminase RidA (YjgF/YER057c/UK114 family)
VSHATDCTGEETVEIQRINPPELFTPVHFTQVVTARAAKTIFVSGQTAFDAGHELVGKDDLSAQAKQAFKNLKMALAAGGAAPRDVVKINVCIVNYQEKHLDVLREGLTECFGKERGFASTLIGVAALARPGLLIEVEAIAVVE